MASDPVFRLHGKEYPVPNDFTLGEMADMERHFGVDFNNPAASKVGMLAATLWIAVRRADDTVSLDDIRALSPDDFQTQGGSAVPLDETKGSEPHESNEPTSATSSDASDVSEPGPRLTGIPTSVTSTDSVPETSLT